MSDRAHSPVTKLRSRISLSCAECKRRKVKCDRKLPCSACVRHNCTSVCGYFGDQLTAGRPSSTEGVSVFRAFADDSARAYRVSDSEIDMGQEQLSRQEQYKNANNANAYSEQQPYAMKRQHVNETFINENFKRAADSSMTDRYRHVDSPMGLNPGSPGTFSQINAPRLPGPQHLARPLPLVSPTSLPSRIPNVGTPLVQTPPNLAGGGYRGHVFQSAALNSQDVERPGTPDASSAPAYLPNVADPRLSAYKLHNGNAPDLHSGLHERQEHMQFPPPPNALPYDPRNTHPPKAQTPDNGMARTMPPSAPTEGYAHFENSASMSYLPPANTRSAPAIVSPAGELSAQFLPQNFSWNGMNPHDLSDPEEEFDLYKGYDPIYCGTNGRTMNHGPFSWYTYVQKDQVLRSLWDYTHESPEVTTFVKARAAHDDDNADKQAKAALYEHELKVELNKRTISLGLTVFEGQVDQNMHLVDRIKLMLPTKKALLTLVGQFFKTVYPYFPLLDERYFCNVLRRILGPFCDREEKYSEIRVTRRDDLASLGILLLVLRMSYLAVLSNQKSENEQVLSASQSSSRLEESKYILNNPISIDVVPVAQSCLDHYNFYQRTSLTVFQCAVLIRAYLTIAPEEGDSADGYESNVFNVMCIQAAYCMGLNREPKTLHKHKENPRLDHLHRKLWFFIRLMDMKSSYQFGFPLMLDDNYNDTEIPSYSPGCSNIEDVVVEEKVCTSLQIIADLYSRMRVLLKSSVSIKHSMKVQKLTELLTELESQTKIKLGTLSDLLRPSVGEPGLPFFKVVRTKTYLNIKSFTLSIIYHLCLNYEKANKHELAYFYLRKFFSFSSGEFLVEVLHMIKQKGVFGLESSASGYILNPPIAFLIHKSNQVNLRLIIILNYMVSTMEHDQESHRHQLRNSPEYKLNFSRICKLARLLEGLNKFSNSCLSVLGNRFFYAWRIAKTHTFLLNTVVSKEFREFRFKRGMDPVLMTPERVKDLLDIAEKACLAVKKCCQAEKSNNAFKSPLARVNDGRRSTPHTTPTVPILDQPLQQFQHRPQTPIQREFSANGLHEHISDLSSNASSTFELGELDLGNSQEIDNLWQQLNSIKNFNKVDGDDLLTADENEDMKGDATNDWYHKLFAFVTPNEMFSSVDENSTLRAFPDLPL